MKIWKHDIVCTCKLEDILNNMQKENKKIEEIIPYSFGNRYTYSPDGDKNSTPQLDKVMVLYTEES